MITEGVESAVEPAGLNDAQERVQEGLRGVLDLHASEGMATTDLGGQLIRPLIAYAGAVGAGESEPDARFWSGALAIQLAHEASLVHDDIIDGAAVRRGVPTVVIRAGVSGALVAGDHLLTTSYRYAAETDSLEFTHRFARAVERTVAGEMRQARSVGRPMDWDEYREIVLAKSGELLGAALATHSLVVGGNDSERLLELGRRLGLVYQMVDDLLDYCPASGTGKPPLADHRQGKWTWVLLELGSDALGRPSDAVVEELRLVRAGSSPLRRCIRTLEQEVERLERDIRDLLPADALLASLLAGWLARARAGVEREERRFDPSSDRSDRLPSAHLLSRIPAPAEVPAYLATNSKSFRFASRLFPSEERGMIERVYAFCRVTDDLADRSAGLSTADRVELLEEWHSLAEAAYDGRPTGIPLLDGVMGEMAARQVPFAYASLLCEGMRMDLEGIRYGTMEELRRYTYRVASVVGLWISELAGLRDPAVLARASAMGHAMQLTNILRDVGEDLGTGRVYLPADLMTRFGVTEEGLGAMMRGEEPIGPGYRLMVEELMGAAEADYDSALEALHHLPRSFRRPVGVAAYVYRGIHDMIRKNGYDNLCRRAHTSRRTKIGLALRALWRVQVGSPVPAAANPMSSVILAGGSAPAL
jgi:15-cis-phytoene synthase